MDPPSPDTKKSFGCAGGVTLFVAVAAYLSGLPLAAWGLRGLTAPVPERDALPALAAGVALAWGVPRLWLLLAPGVIRVTWRDAAAAFPDFALAGLFLLTWARPERVGGDAVERMVTLLVLEFIVIHASVALGATLERRRASPQWMRAFWGLAAVYILAAGGFALGARSVWPLATVLGLTLNKFIAAILDPKAFVEDPDHKARWGFACACYLFFGFCSVLPFPLLGADRPLPGTGDDPGAWQTEPHRALAMGVLYFAALGFYELYGGSGVRRKPDPEEAVVHAG